ncbi:hypothetical protein [Gimesia maris]|uniref:hypothetical protein n=1 Tax=Gimesia maris TaxID=122 RepID=UPI00241D222B|nr:hypothetical protein [Gimesia maris]|tara:strand:+ start:130906 stop:132573 length:1668 start_codon:yes stop_codon:yes gene_type:complete
MSSAFVVTTRLIWKRAWPQALCCIVAFVLFPYVVLKVIAVAEEFEGRVHVDIFKFGFLFGYYMLLSSLVFLVTAVTLTIDFQKYFLRMPIPSRTIASGMMFTAVTLFLSMQLGTNGFYRLLFFDQNWLSDYWPLTGTLLFLVTLTLVGYADFWLMQAPSLTRLCASVSFIAGMLVWFLSRFYPDGFSGAVVPWTRVMPGEGAAMLGVSLGAWYLGTAAFAQIRSGTSLPSPAWERMKQWWNTLAVGASSDRETDPHSQTAIATLKQVHWRNSCRSGVLIGFGLAGVTFFCNLAAFFIWAKPDEFLGPLTYLPALFLTGMFLQFAVGALMIKFGGTLTFIGKQQMKDYWATVPLTDRELAAALMQNILKSGMLVLLAIVPVGLGGSYLLYALMQGQGVVSSDWQFLVEHQQVADAIYLIVFVMLFFWSIMLNFTAVGWFPRPCVGWWVLLALPVLLIISCSVSELLPVLQTPVILLDACLILGVTVLAFLHAYRSALIGGKTLWLSAFFYLLISIAFWNYWDSDLFFDRVLSSALLVFTVLPFATIPLAVSWNRHR